MFTNVLSYFAADNDLMRRMRKRKLTLGWLKKPYSKNEASASNRRAQRMKWSVLKFSPTEQLCDNQTLNKFSLANLWILTSYSRPVWKKGLDNVISIKLMVKLQLPLYLQFCDGEKMTEHLHASASLSVKWRCIIVSIINFPWRLNEYLDNKLVSWKKSQIYSSHLKNY